MHTGLSSDEYGPDVTGITGEDLNLQQRWTVGQRIGGGGSVRFMSLRAAVAKPSLSSFQRLQGRIVSCSS